jgi:hypothetical protein
VRFPKRLKYRGKTLVTIYGKSGGPYRLYWRVRGTDGRPRTRFKDFTRYSAAKKAADSVFKDLSKGSPATALSVAQASDALLAFRQLDTFYQDTGRRPPGLWTVSMCGLLQPPGIRKPGPSR